MNKNNLWFLTLFSLILVLGVYYVTMPNDLLAKIEETTEKAEKPVVEEIKEENVLTAMRVSLEEERKEKLDVLKEQLVSEKLSSQERNNIYEELKYLNEIQGKEEELEKKLKKELELDCFLKIDNSDASVVCISDNHDTSLANKIMRMVQEEYDNKMTITVKFQKK